MTFLCYLVHKSHRIITKSDEIYKETQISSAWVIKKWHYNQGLKNIQMEMMGHILIWRPVQNLTHGRGKWSSPLGESSDLSAFRVRTNGM